LLHIFSHYTLLHTLQLIISLLHTFTIITIAITITTTIILLYYSFTINTLILLLLLLSMNINLLQFIILSQNTYFNVSSTIQR
jgi:hypothetical protein